MSDMKPQVPKFREQAQRPLHLGISFSKEGNTEKTVMTMVGVNPTISVVTSKVSDLNVKDRLSKVNQKTSPYRVLSIKPTLKIKTHRLKEMVGEKISC